MIIIYRFYRESVEVEVGQEGDRCGGDVCFASDGIDSRGMRTGGFGEEEVGWRIRLRRWACIGRGTRVAW
jgi:hypothetical protein